MQRWIFAAVIAFLVLFGLIFLLVSRYVARMVRTKKQNCTAPAKARVTEIKVERKRDATGDYGTYYYPVYEYLANGQMISVQSNTGVGKKQFQVGQTVSLMYNPWKPQEYYCEAEHLSRISTIFIIVTCSVWAAALVLLAVDIFVL